MGEKQKIIKNHCAIIDKNKACLDYRCDDNTHKFDNNIKIKYHFKSWFDSKECHVKPEHCYLPKKEIFSWSGHKKGTQKILWFPKTAHLLASAGLDGKIKIWNVFNDQKCVHTYLNHDRGI